MCADEGDRGGASDGLESDADGNLFTRTYEHNAVLRRCPDGTWVTIAHDPRLLWPDAMSVATDSYLCVTANQLHHQARYNAGQDLWHRAYALFRVQIDRQPVRLHQVVARNANVATPTGLARPPSRQPTFRSLRREDRRRRLSSRCPRSGRFGGRIAGCLEQTIGSLLMLAVLTVVFVTMLYERSRMLIISFYTARAIGRVFYGMASIVERHRGAVMSYCGPADLTTNTSLIACMLQDALRSIDLSAQRVD